MKTVIFVPGINDKYHFGPKDWEDSKLYCPSHTFFSAIVNNYVYLFGNEKTENLKELKVSGVFPCLLDQKNNPFLYFVPKPIGKLNICKNFADENAKKIKKVEFVSLDFLKEQNKRELKKGDFVILGEKFLITIDEFNEICNLIEPRDKERTDEIKEIKLIGTQSEIKTSVDRIKGSSLEGNLYTVKYIKPLVYYKDNKKEIAFKLGFWAAVDFSNVSDNQTLENIEKSIKLIKKQGLGGEISTGAGLFEKILIKEVNDDLKALLEKENSNYYMTLSSYVPTKKEWENKKGWYYQIEKYSGWMFSYVNPKVIGKPKKSIFYLTPGSVFDKKVEGDVKDLSTDPNQPCWFSGKPVLIRINLKGENDEM